MSTFEERRLEDLDYIREKYELLLNQSLGYPFSETFEVRSYERSTYKQIIIDIEEHPDLDVRYILSKRIELLSRGRIWPMMRCKQDLETLYLEMFSSPS